MHHRTQEASALGALVLLVAAAATLANGQRSMSLECPARAVHEPANETYLYLVLAPENELEVPLDGQDYDEKWNRLVKEGAPSGFDPSKRTLVYVHGWAQNAHSRWLERARSSFRQLVGAKKESEPAPFNLFVVDWSAYSRAAYDEAVARVPSVGHAIGKFLAGRVPNDQLHLFGYSLGAHVAAGAARKLAKLQKERQGDADNNQHRVARLTALEPTGICMDRRRGFGRHHALRANDAELVVAEHWDMGGLGASRPVGHLDIFVNGGRGRRSRRQRQRMGALHRRAAQQEAELENDKCHQMAYACRDYRAYLAGSCADCGHDENAPLCYHLNTFASMAGQTMTNASALHFEPRTRMFIKTNPRVNRRRGTTSCLALYQVRVVLGPSETEEQSPRQLRVKYAGRRLRARHVRGGDHGVLTALASFAEPIEHQQELEIVDNPKAPIERVEINYMSHSNPERRRQESRAFCLAPNSAPDSAQANDNSDSNNTIKLVAC